MQDRYLSPSNRDYRDLIDPRTWDARSKNNSIDFPLDRSREERRIEGSKVEEKKGIEMRGS